MAGQPSTSREVILPVADLRGRIAHIGVRSNRRLVDLSNARRQLLFRDIQRGDGYEYGVLRMPG
jgi:hypothetical protein